VESSGRKRLWPNLKYYPGLEGPSETSESISQDVTKLQGGIVDLGRSFTHIIVIFSCGFHSLP
jgi:hypothetical protein